MSDDELELILVTTTVDETRASASRADAHTVAHVATVPIRHWAAGLADSKPLAAAYAQRMATSRATCGCAQPQELALVNGPGAVVRAGLLKVIA
jgi:hypothetical protein